MKSLVFSAALLALSGTAAYSQKCQATTIGAPIGLWGGPRNFTLKLPNNVGRYGDLVKVYVNPEGRPESIETYTPDPFTNTHIDQITDGIHDSTDWVNGQCPDGYTLNGSSAPVRRSLSPQAAPFGPSSAVPNFGQVALSITAGDFNGDGTVDYAYAVNSTIAVTLYGPGNTTLSMGYYSVPSNTESGLIAADFNGDGKPDLLVLQDPASGVNGSVALLLGIGDGTFGAAATIPITGFPDGLAVGDFNGDGKLDIAVSGELNVSGKTSGYLTVLLGRGDGTFSSLPAAQFAGGPMVAVDLTGDGKLDLLTSSIAVYPGHGDGTFGAAIQSPAAGVLPSLSYADLNRDGKVDYVTVDSFGATMRVGFGNGDGTFQTAMNYATPSNVGTAALVPLDDGNTAIVMADPWGQYRLFAFADATGQINLPAIQAIGAAAGENQPALSAADLNGDKKPDLIIAKADGVSVELGHGDGTFAPLVTYPVGGTANAAAVLDLNGDGKPDLFATTASGATVLLNNGEGTFHAGATLGGGPWGYTTVADFNGDGKPDIAVASLTPAYEGVLETVSVLLSKGDGTFAAPGVITLPSGSPNQGGGIVSGDFNGDGKADLLIAYATPDSFNAVLAVYPGKGDGTFGTPLIVPTSGGVFAAGDWNGDGKLDVATYEFDKSEFDVLLGNGDGTFQAPLKTTTDVISTITVADVNHDGKPDLLLGACCGNAEASYMLGHGDGTFDAQAYFLSGPNPNSVAMVDFGNGTSGVAIGGSSFGLPILTVMGTSFPAAAAVVSSAYPQAVGLAPGMLATAYGVDLSSGAPGPTSLPLPLSFEGTSVSITDSAGTVTASPLLYVSPAQVNFEVPAGVALGSAQVNITSGDGTVSSESVNIGAVVPGMFELNSAGLAAADVLVVAGTTQTYKNVYSISSGAIVASPIDLSGAGNQVYLILYGTGFQAAGAAGVKVTIGGVSATVVYAGPQGGFAGLDQANVLIPPSLAGKGNVTIQLTANGIAANPVNVTIQ